MGSDSWMPNSAEKYATGRAQSTPACRAPQVCFELQVLLQPAVGVVDSAVERQLRRALLELLDGDLLEQGDGVVVERAPEHRIDLAEQAGRVGVPAPPEILRQGAQPLVSRRDELSERSRFGDDRRQLRAGHRQQAHVLGPEGTGLDRLDDEHALQQSALDDRHAEKRAIRVFARFRKVLEAGMCGGIGDELRSEAFGDQTREPFRQAHPDAPDAFRAQADRRREHQVGAVGLQEIDRTDVGLESPLDQVDDVVQRLGRVPARRHQPADFLERPERRVLVARRHISDAHRPSESAAGNNETID